MGQNERVSKAISAMKAMGISEKRSKPVLRSLYRLYDKNWQLIEDENYRVLLDAIFEQENEEVEETKKNKERQLNDELSGPPSKRMRLSSQADQATSSGEMLIRRPIIEEADLPIDHVIKSVECEHISSQMHDEDEQEAPASSQLNLRDRAKHDPDSPQCQSRGKEKEPILSSQNCCREEIEQSHLLLEESIAECESISPQADGRIEEPVQSSPDFTYRDKEALPARSIVGVCFKVPKVEPGIILLPKKKLPDSQQSYGLLMPKSEITDDFPPFEVPTSIMRPSNPKPTIDDGSACEVVTSSALANVSETSTTDEVVLPEIRNTLLLNSLDSHHNQKADGNINGERDTDGNYPNSSNSCSLAVAPDPESTIGDVRPLHDVNDISKGEEGVAIAVINEVSSESYPPLFYYIPQNIVFENARVRFSLARIGDEDCCSNCFGDCLSSSSPCACAREMGGEFAYTLEGLLKETFLDECISLSRDPQQDRRHYCKECPLGRSKEGSPDPCKGHLVRIFVKECWSKCGCNKRCGNRVVQRGITCNLQVFLTSEGKGWGLRTLEDLPKGTFVCEYVGEVLTNTELYDRNISSTDTEKHTHRVLLDADWRSKGVLKDEEALCLDATYYGNVARFINHRCFDANIVEIPVKVEMPDHHYYHLAFFTTRNVYALEELTWDYGVDFNDHDHPVNAFRCHCGSKYCRYIKHLHGEISEACSCPRGEVSDVGTCTPGEKKAGLSTTKPKLQSSPRQKSHPSKTKQTLRVSPRLNYLPRTRSQKK